MTKTMLNSLMLCALLGSFSTISVAEEALIANPETQKNQSVSLVQIVLRDGKPDTSRCIRRYLHAGISFPPQWTMDQVLRDGELELFDGNYRLTGDHLKFDAENHQEGQGKRWFWLTAIPLTASDPLTMNRPRRNQDLVMVWYLRPTASPNQSFTISPSSKPQLLSPAEIEQTLKEVGL